MYAIEAIYDGNNFTPTHPIDIKEEYKVMITFVEPINHQSKWKNNNRILSVPEPKKSSVVALGLWNGHAIIPDNFNEPLEDLKEYMF